MISLNKFVNLFFCYLVVVPHLLCFMGSIKVGSLNLNGARDQRKRASLFKLISMKKLDVVFLQETHSTEDNEIHWNKEWEGRTFLSHKSSTSCGVGILFSRNFMPQSVLSEEVIKGRLLKITADYENIKMIFINIYAPVLGTERLSVLDVLNDEIEKCNNEGYLFIGGDFNCTVNSELDRNHPEPHPASHSRLLRLIQAHELMDVWRGFHGKQRQYTWCHVKDNSLSMARLDRFYCFRHHFNVFKGCTISPVGFSDHSLLIASVFINNVKPNSAYWHLNISLLEDRKFKEIFKFFWEAHQRAKADFKSLQQWWDVGKTKIKQFCMEYTKNITKTLTNSVRILETEVEKLQQVAEATGDPRCSESLAGKKSALNKLLSVSAQGALVRSRFRNVAMMDVPSHFFFGLERKNGQKRFIHSLRSETGQVLTNHEDICKRAVGFYKELFKCEHQEEQEASKSFYEGLPQVEPHSNKDLEAALSSEELHAALQGMQSGKAPGIDGLPVDFYKALWSVVGGDLLSVLNESLAGGRLPLSCRRAVLTLLPKKGDPQRIENWRPVSLLCTDYKLLSKALSNRLSKVMGQLIHADQTYCVPGRLINDNITLIRDFLDICKLFGIRAGIISIDQEKAFDRVEHEYLWLTLSAFGFSPVFINKIKVLYGDVHSILKINGGLSAPFQVQRGVRQGCALSGMLYSLAIEPLLHRLRCVLQRVRVPGCAAPFKLSAYADDVVVLTNCQQDIDVLEKTVLQFRLISSARINWQKSEALSIGSADELILPGGLIWKRGGLKYLGVFLGDQNTVLKNWEDILEKVKGRLSRWKWIVLNLSYRGRILILNNLVSSTLWHRLAAVDPPPDLLSRIQAVIVDFFWDKLHWLPQGVLYLPKDEGGQGLVHLGSRGVTFRLQFLQRFLRGPADLVWRPLAETILRRCSGLGLGRTLFLMDLKEPHMRELPCFYRGLFKVWSFFKKERPDSQHSLFWLLQEPIVHGTRSNSVCQLGPTLVRRCCEANVLTLGRVVELTGPSLEDAAPLASRLGVGSVRTVSLLLSRWRAALTNVERMLLTQYMNGSVRPNENDMFPPLNILPDFKNCVGPFLNNKTSSKLPFFKANGKAEWESRHPLEGSPGPGGGLGPEWRALYKPPLTKRAADLQWRLLHGIVAVNAFVSVISPTVSPDCPFCSSRETVFHCFSDCSRLLPLFSLLGRVLNLMGETLNKQMFVFGYRFSSKHKNKCQLINFHLGTAKMAVYMSRKNRLENLADDDAVFIFVKCLKARLKIDFNYYMMMKDVETFCDIWSFNNVLCSVVDDQLIYRNVLM
uniref:Reverse transcriptase domain-containing protein n=1 Tax=Seriola dumerili TaxID=41447 RepID=A0A3B4TQD0_SERDU